MFHLLKLEWLKQKNYVLFKILLLVYIVMLPAVLMIGKKIPYVEGMPFNPEIMFFHFPSVWEWLAFIGNWGSHLIFAFMAVLLVTNEHSFRTLRQNVITGMQRSDWFWSKAQFLLVVAAGATLYLALCAIVIGLFHADTIYLATVFKGAGSVMLRYFLMIVGFMGFGFLVGVLVKRTGIALFVLLAYTFMAEPVIRWVLHLRLLKHESWNWYPWNIFEDLCHVPSADIANEFLEDNGIQMVAEPAVAIPIAIGYILLFGWLSHRRLVKGDL